MPGQKNAGEAEVPTATQGVNNDAVQPAEEEVFKPAKESERDLF